MQEQKKTLMRQRRQAQKVRAEIKAHQLLLLQQKTLIKEVVPQVDANGFIDHKVDFGENLSESGSNSWCDEVSQQEDQESDEDTPTQIELTQDQGLSTKQQDSVRKPRAKKEIIRLMPEPASEVFNTWV